MEMRDTRSDWLTYIFFKMNVILDNDRGESNSHYKGSMLEYISAFEQRLYQATSLAGLEKSYKDECGDMLVPYELYTRISDIRADIDDGRAAFDIENGNQIAYYDGEQPIKVSSEEFNKWLGHDLFINDPFPETAFSYGAAPSDSVKLLKDNLDVIKDEYGVNSWVDAALRIRDDIQAVKDTFNVRSVEEFDKILMNFIERICSDGKPSEDKTERFFYLDISKLNNAIQPFITPEKFSTDFEAMSEDLTSKNLFSELSVKDDSITEVQKISRRTFRNRFVGALVYQTNVNKALKLDDKAQEYTIDSVNFRPFTKKEILERSVGQIVSDSLDLAKEYRIYNDNTLVNKAMFSSDSRILTSNSEIKSYDRSETNLPDAMNYGHIWMPIPIVNPTLLGLKPRSSKIASNKLKAILGVYSSAPTGGINRTLSDLAFYDWCLVIPKSSEDKEVIYRLFALYRQSVKGSSRSSGGRQDLMNIVHTLNYTEDNSGKNTWKFAPREYMLVRREFMINPGDTLKNYGTATFNMREISNLQDGYDQDTQLNLTFWTNHSYILSGAYAITYLLSRVDIRKNVLYGVEHLQCLYRGDAVATDESTSIAKISGSVSVDILTEHIKILKGVLDNQDSSLLDWITNVIPVIPLRYRPCDKKTSNGESITQVDKLNTQLYQPILRELQTLPANYQGTPVPFEVLFECGRDSDIDKQSNMRLKQCLKVISGLLNGTQSMDICDKFRRIQEHICNTAGEQMSLLGGKYGYIRDECLTKRINDTGRSVITVDPTLKLDEIGVPYNVLKCWYDNDIKNYINSEMGLDVKKYDTHREYAILFSKWLNFMSDSEETTYAKVNSQEDDTDAQTGAHLLKVVVKSPDNQEKIGYKLSTPVERLSPEQLRSMRNTVEELAIKKLNQLIGRDRTKLLMIRFPSLWKYNELTMNIKVVKDDSIHFHPLCCACYNADFDGDQMSMYLLRTPPAVAEAERLMMPSKNKVGYNGDPMLMPSQDAILGLYYLTLNKNADDILNNTCNTDTEDSPVLRTFSCYDDMYSAYERHEVGLFDKVRVYLPHYKNCNFYSEYFTQKELEKPHNLKGIDLKVSGAGLDLTHRPYQVVTDNNGDTGNTRIRITLSTTTDSNMNSIGQEYDSSAAIIPDTQFNSKKQPVISTVGRFILNNNIPQNLGFVKRDEKNFDNPCNYELEIDDKSIKSILGINLSGAAPDSKKTYEDIKKVLAAPKKVVKSILSATIEEYDSSGELGSSICNCVHDNLKKLGFTFATLSGLSLSLDDMKTNPAKGKIMEAYTEKINKIYNDTSIPSDEERKEKAISTWEDCTKEVMNTTLEGLPVTNTLRMMSFSGARGSDSQLSQLMGMRGIMLDADSRKVETPIKNSFIEGIYPEDFFIASAGTNKGMIDRANKTQDTGAFTRTMIFGTEGIHIGSGDCGDHEGTLLYNTPIETYNYDIRLGTGYMNMQNRKSVIYVTAGSLQKDGVAIIDSYGNYYIDNKPVYNIYTRRILDPENVTVQLKDGHTFSADLSDGTHIAIRTDVTFDADNSIDSLDDELQLQFSDGAYLKFTNKKDQNRYYITSTREIGVNGDAPIFMESSTGNTDKYICNGMPIGGPDKLNQLGDKWSFNSEDGDCEYTRSIPTVNGIPAAVVEVGEGYTYAPFTTCVSPTLGTQLGNQNWFIEYGENNDWTVKKYDKKNGVKFTVIDESSENKDSKIITVKLSDDTVSMLDNTPNRPRGCLFAVKPVDSSFIGRFIADTVYDKVTGEILLQVDKPISKSDKANLKKALQQHPEGLFIRSPMSCKSHDGICAKCYGYNYGTDRYARIGDQVDKSSSHVLGEYLSQSTMRTFHTGGAATGGNVTDTFKAIKALLESGDIKDKYIQSLAQGVKAKGDSAVVPVSEIKRIQSVTKETLPKIYAKQKTSTNNGTLSGAKANKQTKDFEGFSGQSLGKAGFEAFGVANIVYFTELQKYLMTQINSILGTSSLSVKNIHIEVMLRSLLQHFMVVDSGDSLHLVGTDIDIHDLIKENVSLAIAGRDTIVAVPTVYKLNKSAFSSDKPMQQMQYREVTKSVIESVTQSKKDDLKSGITTIMVGNSVYAGDKILHEAEESSTELPQVKSIEELTEVPSDESANNTSYVKMLMKATSELAPNSSGTVYRKVDETKISPEEIFNVVSKFVAQKFDSTATDEMEEAEETSDNASNGYEDKDMQAAVFGEVTYTEDTPDSDISTDIGPDEPDESDIDFTDEEEQNSSNFDFSFGFRDKNMDAAIFGAGDSTEYEEDDEESDEDNQSDSTDDFNINTGFSSLGF